MSFIAAQSNDCAHCASNLSASAAVDNKNKIIIEEKHKIYINLLFSSLQSRATAKFLMTTNQRESAGFSLILVG